MNQVLNICIEFVENLNEMFSITTKIETSNVIKLCDSIDSREKDSIFKHDVQITNLMFETFFTLDYAANGFSVFYKKNVCPVACGEQEHSVLSVLRDDFHHRQLYEIVK